jgi:hypothetical protein
MSLPDDRNGLGGHLRGVATFNYQSGEWVEEELAGDATQEGPGDSDLSITERVPDVSLPTQRVCLAPRAPMLPVEGLELVGLRTELVLVSLDGFPGQLGVHLFEDRHGVRS